MSQWCAMNTTPCFLFIFYSKCWKFIVQLGYPERCHNQCFNFYCFRLYYFFNNFFKYSVDKKNHLLFSKKLRSSSIKKLRSSSIFKNIEVIFHISSGWVKIWVAYTENQLSRWSRTALIVMIPEVVVWWWFFYR